MGSCANRPPQCIICTGPYKVKKHRCGIAGCNKEKGKICAHVTAKCANCGENYTANSPQCTSRHKTDIEARKRKKLRDKKGKKNPQVEDASEAENKGTEKSPEPDIEMDLEDERWAQSLEAETPQFEDNKSQDHIKDF